MGDEKKRHSAGWYAGAAVFWLLTAWLVTVGLSSIIPQIFWPAGEARATSGSCRAELRELRRELLSRTGDSMSTAPTAAERSALDAWLADWDHQLAVARPACGEEEQKAWGELFRLRHGMRALVDRFDREEAPRIRKLDQLLGTDREARAP